MVIDLLNYIADEVATRNPYFNHYDGIAQQTSDGRVFRFSVADEKKFCGINDSEGIGFYVKVDPKVSYTLGKFITSTKQINEGNISCNLVAYQVNSEINILNWIEKIVESLKSVDFTLYTGDERHIKVEIQSTSASSETIFKEETTKEFAWDASLKVISILYIVKFSTTKYDCNECNIFDQDCESNIPRQLCQDVTIESNDGLTIIQMVPAGGIYRIPAAGTCADANVSNSDDSYIASVVSGGSLELPDINIVNSNSSFATTHPSAKNYTIPNLTLSNSDASYSESIPSAFNKVLSDITVTDSDGVSSAYPAKKNYTCTPQIKTTFLSFVFGIGATADYTQTIVSGEEGVYTAQSLVNVTSVIYKKNTVVATLPITLIVGDTLEVIPTITNTAIEARVKLTGTYT